MVACRFIPIHTGNSILVASLSRKPPVHPHTHGELFRPMVSIPVIRGSSPYTRGTQEDRHFYRIALRFIPIHTGNSSLYVEWWIAASVHPHTHGELHSLHPVKDILCGSSPYTRGTPRFFRLTVADERFIPIHTGNSSYLLRITLPHPVHPHTHGELVFLTHLIWFVSGSSPYTRGTLHAFCITLF